MPAAFRRFGWVLAVFAMAVNGAMAVSGPAWGQSYEDGLKAFEAEQYDRAYQIWQPLADAGDPIAQYSLGKLFERGGGAVRQDFAQAARWYRSAAAQGVAAAQNNLALMHAQGRGTPRDVGKAIELWLQAARQNHPMAQYNLGLAYFRGEGVEKDERQAAGWFRRAADAGLSDAQYAMGQMNRLGLVLPKDQGVALAWYQLASSQGHREAKMQAQLLGAAGVQSEQPGDPIITPKSLAEAPGAAQPAPQKAAEPEVAAASQSEPVREIDPAAAGAKVATTTAAMTGTEPRSRVVQTTDPSVGQAAAPQPASAAGGGTETAAAQAAPAAEPYPLPRKRPAAQLAMQGAGEAPPPGPADEAGTTNLQTLESAAGRLQTAAAAPAASEHGSNGSKTPAPKPREKVAATSAPTTAASPDAKQQDAKQDANAAEAPAQAPQVAAVPAGSAQPAARDGVRVWLASERDPAAAQAFWSKTRSAYPDLLAQAEPAYAKVDMGKSGVFYRVMAGPLGSRDAARDLCAMMRQKDEDAFCKVLSK